MKPSDLECNLPDFAALEAEHFPPAFEAAMAADVAAVHTVLADPGPPTMENTLDVLEREGLFLDRVESTFFTLTAGDLSDDLQAIYEDLATKLSQHRADITLNRHLYQRIAAVPEDGLSRTQLRVLREYRRWFERSGVLLDAAAQARLREINDRISTLGIRYGTHLVRENQRAAVLVTDRDRLAGMEEADIDAAASAAAEAGHDGAYLLALAAFTTQPVLAQLHDRQLRQEIHQAAMDRGRGPSDPSGELPTSSREDLRPIAAELAGLRAEQAQLLGFNSHDEFVMAGSAAGEPGRVHNMMSTVTPAAVRNAVAEREQLERRAGHPIQPWDWPYWAARAEISDADESPVNLRDYFELESVVHHGLFHTARELFGLEFTQRDDLRGHLPGVVVYQCRRAATGETVGLVLADWWARPTKSGGAWMGTLVHQNRLGKQRPVVTLNTNFTRAPQGSPKLLSHSEVITLFHEFGHVLHGLLSDVFYPSFAGTKVARDVVEFPSQVYEMWVDHADVLPVYAKHHHTGEPLPQVAVDKLRSKTTSGQGFATVEYLAATAIDLAWHERTPEAPAPELATFDRDAVEAAGLLVDGIDPRYTSGSFKHIFAGGYSAGYYSYLWSEIIDADAVEWFNAHGGLSAEAGAEFARCILSRGNETDPMDGVRALLGREPDMGPLLARRGLH